jgi:hypothetical protein
VVVAWTRTAAEAQADAQYEVLSILIIRKTNSTTESLDLRKRKEKGEAGRAHSHMPVHAKAAASPPGGTCAQKQFRFSPSLMVEWVTSLEAVSRPLQACSFDASTAGPTTDRGRRATNLEARCQGRCHASLSGLPFPTPWKFPAPLRSCHPIPSHPIPSKFQRFGGLDSAESRCLPRGTLAHWHTGTLAHWHTGSQCIAVIPTSNGFRRLPVVWSETPVVLSRGRLLTRSRIMLHWTVSSCS